MKLDEFEKWLEQMEKQSTSTQLSDEEKQQFMTRLHEQLTSSQSSVSNTINPKTDEIIEADKVLENFDPKLYPANPKLDETLPDISPKQKHRSHKMGIVIVAAASLIFLSLSAITYATITHYYGVYKSTPEVDNKLDKPNETQILLDSIDDEVIDLENKYSNTEILTENSFENPQFYNTITDVILIPDENNIYTTENFIFNNCDMAAFKKDNNGSWHLEQGETLTITIAIDTSFAACEPEGEYVEFAYITNGKYKSFHVQKITDVPTRISFSAPETGDYYFAIVNLALSYMKVTELEIQ